MAERPRRPRSQGRHMCARFTADMTEEELALAFGLTDPPAAVPRRYNVAPGQTVPVVRLAAGGRELVGLRWGLVPGWARPGTPQARAGLVNARAETAAGKPAFRDAVRGRRCLVPATGFIEWETAAGRKQPHLFRPAGGGPVAFAGVWEPGAGDRAGTFAVLTVPAGPDVEEFHDRMPAVLRPAEFGRWLDPRAGWEELRALLAPFPAGGLVRHPVSPAINRPENDRPGLLEPVAAGLFG